MCGLPQNDTTSSFFSLHPNCGKWMFRFTIMCSENNTLRQSEMRHFAVLVEISQWNKSLFLPRYTVSHTRTGSSQKFSLLWRLVILLSTLIWLPSWLINTKEMTAVAQCDSPAARGLSIMYRRQNPAIENLNSVQASHCWIKNFYTCKFYHNRLMLNYS